MYDRIQMNMYKPFFRGKVWGPLKGDPVAVVPYNTSGYCHPFFYPYVVAMF